ncbi:hypothetical protein AKJ16_DCAP04954, partial [Drosera capensis]
REQRDNPSSKVLKDKNESKCSAALCHGCCGLYIICKRYQLLFSRGKEPSSITMIIVDAPIRASLSLSSLSMCPPVQLWKRKHGFSGLRHQRMQRGLRVKMMS